MPRHKPLGIELLAIVIVINGIFCFFSGIDSLVFSSFLKSSIPLNTTVLRYGESTATFLAAWGSILLVIGIMSFIAAFGLFTGAGWGWTVSLALSFIGIAVPLVNLFSGYWPSIFTIMLSSFILIYLLKRDVRAYFRRAVPTHSGAEAA